MAALLAAVTGTIGWLYPDIPVVIVGLWSAAFMAAVGIGEVWFDRNSTSVPNDSTPSETKAILKEAK
ncbi:MAG: hypothetical protein NUW01_05635 [Gemmatimonadaceae bacterium]|nr:hypothetical protein [Gemmatimonadaceae bacterium]